MAGIRQFDEQAVLKKALELFWQKGYRSTSMIDLATYTGIQRGSLYNTYKSKENLFIQSFSIYADFVLKNIEESLQSNDIEAAITRFFECMVQRLQCDDQSRNGCLGTRTIMESIDEEPVIGEQLKKLYHNYEELLYQRLEQAKKVGQFTGNSRDSARYLAALARGIAVTYQLYRDTKELQKIYRTAIKTLPFYKDGA